MRDLQLSKGRRVFVGNTLSLVVLQGAKYIFPLVTLPYLARVLGPDAYAVRAYVVSFMVFIQTIADYGFAQYGTKIVAQNADDVGELSRICSNIYIAKLFTCSIGLFVTLMVLPFIELLAQNSVFVLVSFASIAFKALLPDFVLQGLENMKSLTLRFVVTQGLAILAIFVFVRGPEGLLLVPMFEGAASLISIVWTQVYLMRYYSIHLGRFALCGVVGIVRKSTPFFFAAAASSFMASTITVFMGIFPTDNLVISCWSITATLIQGIQALYQPISRSLFPHMVKRKDVGLVWKLLKLGMPVNIVGVLICMVFADPIIGIVAGADYIQGSYVLRFVAPVLIFSYPISIVGYPVIGTLGNSVSLPRCILVGALFQISVLVIAGVSGQFGIVAMSLARVGSEALICALETWIAAGLLRTGNLGTA